MFFRFGVPLIFKVLAFGQVSIPLQRLRAERILEGDSDNYDGADGARIILSLCEEIERLRGDDGIYKLKA
uniref:Uncharacterized protein n=1 Tax=viral metagenome TaxID=1070528 RepID=A0A6M3LBK9_9ZZZZ